MPGMTGKRQRFLSRGGGRGKRPRPPSTHRADHNGVAASNGASHHAERRSFAEEASDDDLDTLPVPGNANAYSALLGALSSSTAAREAHRRSPAAVPGKRAAKNVVPSDGSGKHARRSVAADSASPAPEEGRRSSTQPRSAQAIVSLSGGERASKRRKGGSLDPSDNSRKGGDEAAAAAQDPALDAVPVPDGSAVAGVAHEAQTNGAGGSWGLAVEDDAVDAGTGGDGAEPHAEAAADETPVQDFFSAHFDRCRQGPKSSVMTKTVQVTHGPMGGLTAHIPKPPFVCTGRSQLSVLQWTHNRTAHPPVHASGWV